MSDELSDEELLKLINEAIPQVKSVKIRGKMQLDCYVVAIQYITKLAKIAYAKGKESKNEN